MLLTWVSDITVDQYLCLGAKAPSAKSWGCSEKSAAEEGCEKWTYMKLASVYHLIWFLLLLFTGLCSTIRNKPFEAHAIGAGDWESKKTGKPNSKVIILMSGFCLWLDVYSFSCHVSAYTKMSTCRVCT